MRDDLLLYYERELTYMRQIGAQFAEKYPKIASRLVLESTKCDDPHVERLLEAFAFLAARVHLKIDDEFPEITEALLGIVYPHFIRPLPSMSIVQFHLDPQKGKLTSGCAIPRETMLYSRPVDGVPCKFRTCFDTTLWPITVTAASWTSPDRLKPPLRAADGAGALRIELACNAADMEFAKLELDELRFFLDGESALVHTIYEILCCNLLQVVVRDTAPGSRVPPVTLPASSLRPVGFEENEGMLPYPKRSFIGYRLLQEYFAFADKFFFVDLNGLRQACAGSKRSLELIFVFSRFEGDERRQRLETGITPATFRLGCSPVANLFPQTAEPILLDQQRYEYPIIPDARRPLAMEVFSVDYVASLRAQHSEMVEYQPFYSFRHSTQRDKQQTFWVANRRPSVRPNDNGTELDLALVDLSFRPTRPSTDALTVRTTCANRDLPARLPFGNEAGDFEVETGAPIKRIVALRKPTMPIRPPLGKAMQWRLISHLSLNYLSLVSEGREALQEILKLYDFVSSAYSSKIVEGITGLSSKRVFSRVISDDGIAFARGTRVELELDEEQFVGGGVYLFASVIEYFLAQYASLNSFSQLSCSVQQRKEVLREWAPRAGRRILM
ncbi:MAG TPA: type VI secretion system baseplate subunit TssF [Bryobacteraceae bacterium]|nr:type VI secretion system baseplate subunit TssF [Bryobacteraceae bacterium]